MNFNHVAALAAAISLAAVPVLAETKVPEGTEFPMRLEDKLSSKTTQDGDRFTITLDDDVRLPDGTVLKAGYRGVGEVVDATKSGMLGKTGKLNIRLNYLRIGDQRIRLRGSKNTQGDHNTGAQVVTFVFVGLFAGFIKGKNTEIPKGTMFNAYAEDDLVLTTPIAPPPAET